MTTLKRPMYIDEPVFFFLLNSRFFSTGFVSRTACVSHLLLPASFTGNRIRPRNPHSISDAQLFAGRLKRPRIDPPLFHFGLWLIEPSDASAINGSRSSKPVTTSLAEFCRTAVPN